jgi:RNA polymerase sigma-70 factor (ECF subfamily)
MALRADDVDLRRDRDLVVRSQAGDDGAFEDLYRRYFGRLYRYCLRRVGDPHEAEELAQEAFARAYGALPRLAGERRFYPWLSVIASRLCADEYRRRARTEPAAVIDLGAREGGEEGVIQALDTELLRQAMGRLTPRHRQILSLREHEGWSYQHIAEYLGVSLGTVEALLHRARKALKREFDHVAGPELVPVAVGGPAFGWLARRMQSMRSRLRVDEWLNASWAPAVGNAVAAAVVVVVGTSTMIGGAGASPSVAAPMAPAAAVQGVAAAPAAAPAPVVAAQGSTPPPAAPAAASGEAPASVATPAPAPKPGGPDLTVGTMSFRAPEETHGDEGRQRAKDQEISAQVMGVITGASPAVAAGETAATATDYLTREEQ